MTDGVWLQGRWKFLWTVIELPGGAIRELLEEVYPRYPDEGWRSEFETWSKKWGLEDDWIRQEFESNLRQWHRYPENHGNWRFGLGVSRMPDLPDPGEFFPRYVPVVHDREEARRRIESKITDYLNAVESAYGYEIPGKQASHHFRWLAQRQVLQKTLEEIVSDHHERSGELVTPQAVSKGTKETAQKIGLTLR